MYYDPNIDDRMSLPNEFVIGLKENVKKSIMMKAKRGEPGYGEENHGELKENLGELMDADQLRLLVDSTGKLYGLQPMAPKKA